MKSSVQAKTNSIPVILALTSDEANERLGKTPEYEAAESSIPPNTNEVTETVERLSRRPEDTSVGGFLSRDEFFDEISGLFGRRIPERKASSNSWNEAREEFIKQINASKVFSPPKANRVEPTSFPAMDDDNATLRPLVEPKFPPFENPTTVIPDNPTVNSIAAVEEEDELVTGEHRTCSGCMRYFIQDLDNCSPCVFPR